MSEPRLVPERRDLVWFSGSDFVRFLNDLISQEVAAVDGGTVVRSLLLGAQGKLDHILWVLRGVDAIGLVTDEGRGEQLASTLGRYRIRVDVDIHLADDPGWLVLGLPGVQPGSWSEESGTVVAGLPWAGPALSLIVGSRPELEEVSWEDWERIRIEAGEPRFGVDVDQSTIPQESGLVPVSVDFTKGCYLGQELVARIDSRGHVNRHLRLLRFDGPCPSSGSEVRDVEKGVGVMTSASGDLGLGLIRREVSPGDRVEVAGVPAEVLGIPGAS